MTGIPHRASAFLLAITLTLSVTSSGAFVDLQAQPRFEYRPVLLAYQQSAIVTAWRLEQNGRARTIRQTYLPVAIRVPIHQRTDLSVIAAGGVSRADFIPGSELQALTDVSLRLSHRFLSDHWFIAGGVNLPAGKNRLDRNENLLVDKLAEIILGFPLQRYGAGLDYEVSLAHASNLSSVLGLGIGGSLVVPGKFVYRSDQRTTYWPGKRSTLTMVLNYVGNPVQWRINLQARFFGTDKLDGREFFSQGWQIEQGGFLKWLLSRHWQAGLSVRQIWKADNELHSTLPEMPAPEHYYVDNSTHLELAIDRNSGRTQLGMRWRWSQYGESNQQLSRAMIWQVGAQAVQKISEHWMLGARGNLAAGTANRREINLRGYSWAVWLRAQR